jgi:hypothetical protein
MRAVHAGGRHACVAALAADGVEHLVKLGGERLRLARIPVLAAEEAAVVAGELDRLLAESLGGRD